MATHSTPHFHNQPGVPQVRVGAKEFMCVGALPPFDHPHIFIDMGEDNDAICPYCSTHFAYDETLHGAANRRNVFLNRQSQRLRTAETSRLLV
jgi:uncharacterized Zn-finger protein